MFTDISDKYAASIFRAEELNQASNQKGASPKQSAIHSSEIPVNFYWITRHHTAENSTLQVQFCTITKVLLAPLPYV
jgi:hypothetical protein